MAGRDDDEGTPCSSSPRERSGEHPPPPLSICIAGEALTTLPSVRDAGINRAAPWPAGRVTLEDLGESVEASIH